MGKVLRSEVATSLRGQGVLGFALFLWSQDPLYLALKFFEHIYWWFFKHSAA